VTLNFGLLIPKYETFISVQHRINAVTLVKIYRIFLYISGIYFSRYSVNVWGRYTHTDAQTYKKHNAFVVEQRNKMSYYNNSKFTPADPANTKKLASERISN